MALLVMVAHTGKTLQLDVHPATRVDAMQIALATFTGVPAADQICMVRGAKMDPSRTLAAYRLPTPDSASAEGCPVFLYSRAHLAPGAPLPAPEALPPISPQVPPEPPPSHEPPPGHPLASCAVPAVRALPALEATLAHALAAGRAYAHAAALRLTRCRQLLSEQEVQARAADAGRANAEAHYAVTADTYAGFMARYNAQAAAHAELLGRFADDLAALDACALHPSLQSEGVRVLGALSAVARAREVAEQCRRSHTHLALRVGELEGVFESLKRDVEGLLLGGPRVDLDALGAQVGAAEAGGEEARALVAALAKDAGRVSELVERAVRALASGSISTQLGDEIAAAGMLGAAATGATLPRLVQCDASAGALEARCVAAKGAMTGDVVDQLRAISAQQSKVRDMRSRLAAYGEVLARQGAACGELRLVARLPVAYRALLSECVRRRAWHELYAGQASKLAEHLGALRDKEAAKRAAFVSQVERYLPHDLLQRAGITPAHGGASHDGGLPHPVVTVTPPPPELLQVTLADVARVRLPSPYTIAAAQRAGPGSSAGSVGGEGAAAVGGPLGASTSMSGPGTPGAPGAAAALSSATSVAASMAAVSAALSTPLPQAQAAGGSEEAAGGGEAGAGGGALLPPPTSMPALEMENARLRAELAAHLAAAALRELATVSTGQGVVGLHGPPGPEATSSSSQLGGPPLGGIERSTSWSRRGAAGGDAAGSSGAASRGPASAATSPSLAQGLPPRGPAALAAAQAAPSPASSPSAAGSGVARPPQPAGMSPGEPLGAGGGAAEAGAVAALRKALTARDAYADKLAREVCDLSARSAAYEARIGELEEAVRRAALASTPAAAGIVHLPPGHPHPATVMRGGSGGTDGGLVITAAPSPAPSLTHTPDPGYSGLAAAAARSGEAVLAGSAAATMTGHTSSSQGQEGAALMSPAPQRLPQLGAPPTAMSRVGSGGLLGSSTVGQGTATNLAHSQPSLGGGMVLGGAGGSGGLGGAMQSGSGRLVLGGSPHLPLGPIALAALNGSRGHTPEPGQSARRSVEGGQGQGAPAWPPLPSPATTCGAPLLQQVHEAGMERVQAAGGVSGSVPLLPALASLPGLGSVTSADGDGACEDDPLGASTLGARLSRSSLLLPLSHSASQAPSGAASSTSSAAPAVLAVLGTSGDTTASAPAATTGVSAAMDAAAAAPSRDRGLQQDVGAGSGSGHPTAALMMGAPLGSLPFAASLPTRGLSTELGASALGALQAVLVQDGGTGGAQVVPSTGEEAARTELPGMVTAAVADVPGDGAAGDAAVRGASQGSLALLRDAAVQQPQLRGAEAEQEEEEDDGGDAPDIDDVLDAGGESPSRDPQQPGRGDTEQDEGLLRASQPRSPGATSTSSTFASPRASLYASAWGEH